jgi:peroxiredoxin
MPSASALIGLTLVLAACGRPASSGGAVGDAAPAYAAVTPAGDSVRLDALRGDAVLLNVWATWCAPCRDEMPALETLHRTFGGAGLRVLGASVDIRASDGDVARFVRDNGITFLILRDPTDRVSRTFGFIGVPNTVLIDRRGVITRRWSGPFDPAAPDVAAAIRQALGV